MTTEEVEEFRIALAWCLHVRADRVWNSIWMNLSIDVFHAVVIDEAAVLTVMEDELLTKWRFHSRHGTY